MALRPSGLEENFSVTEKNTCSILSQSLHERGNLLHLSLPQARALMLAAQGLLSPPRRKATKADVLAAIQRMGALQIDTISVVARSPYFVLWSRLGAYDPRWLDELLAEGELFEYWAHAACFLPMSDFPIHRPRMLHGHDRSRAWLAGNPDVVAGVLARLQAVGTVRSADFARTGGPAGPWWDWKPEKAALECLFDIGEVMIARRDNFQRVYALRREVLPDWDDAGTPSLDRSRRALILLTVRALGMARQRWLPFYFNLPATGIPTIVDELIDAGELVPATVDGWEDICLVHPDNFALAVAASRGELNATLTTLLSPFDPLIWHRDRVLEAFGLHYRIETYTPASKRRYGYFSLPILRRAALIGRVDAKAHRKQRRFEVRSIHLEPGVRITNALVRDLYAVLARCARWHNTPEVTVVSSDPPNLAEALNVR